MPSAKDIHLAPIAAADAIACVKRHHYSGKVVQNSQLHLGVFLNGRLEGAMQFGPSLDKRKLQGLVEDTPWNGFIELNRMAFSERLPRNSESRALGVAFQLIRKAYPHLQWVVSFADATQSGDGTIYRAAGFVLTGIKPNRTIVLRENGTVGSELVGGLHVGGSPLAGFQLRYLYFLDRTARERLTVPSLKFDAITHAGAGMYRGQKRVKQATDEHPSSSGGAAPTLTLHITNPAEAAP